MSPEPETRSVAGHEVRLERTLTTDEDGALVRARVVNEAPHPVVVRVRDEVPADVEVERAEFHPEYRPERWTASADEVRFEDVVGPESEQVVAYGFLLADVEHADELGPPTLEEVLPAEAESVDGGEAPLLRGGPEYDSEVAEGGVSETAREWAAGSVGVNGGTEGTDAPTVGDGSDAGGGTAVGSDDGTPGANEPFGPAMEDDAGSPDRPLGSAADAGSHEDPIGPASEEAEADIGTAPADGDETAGAPAPDEGELAGPSAEGDAGEGTLGAPDGTAPHAAPGPDAAGGEDSLVAALVAELEDGDVPEEQKEALREALDVGPSRSDEVRIEHIQSRMGDLAAYVDALEELIDDHGTATEFVSEIKSDLADLEAELEAVDDDLAAAATEREELRDDAAEAREALRDDLEDLRDRVDEVAADLEAELEELGEEQSAAADERADIADGVDHLATRIDAGVRDRGRVEERVDGLATDLDAAADERTDIADDVRDLESALESIEERLGEEVGTLRDDLAALREDRAADVEEFADELADLEAGLGAVEDELADIREEVERNCELRKALAGAVGPAPGFGDDDADGNDGAGADEDAAGPADAAEADVEGSPANDGDEAGAAPGDAPSVELPEDPDGDATDE